MRPSTLGSRRSIRTRRTSSPIFASTSRPGAGPPLSTSTRVCPGAKDRRPALDALVQDAKRRQFDVLVCWRLDRLGRNLRHLVTLLDELQVLGVSFVSLGEGIDCTTPAGRLQLHVLAALAEFERARIAERVAAGLARARKNGQRLGRPERVVSEAVLAPVRGLSVREAAKQLGVSRSTAHRWLARHALVLMSREGKPPIRRAF